MILTSENGSRKSEMDYEPLVIELTIFDTEDVVGASNPLEETTEFTLPIIPLP